MPALTIARAAREAGVNIQTVRFYERRGLIERYPCRRAAPTKNPAAGSEVAQSHDARDGVRVDDSRAVVQCQQEIGPGRLPGAIALRGRWWSPRWCSKRCRWIELTDRGMPGGHR